MQNDEIAAILKTAGAWVGALIGSITLSKAVLLATLVFTVLQTYCLVRDKLFRRSKKS